MIMLLPYGSTFRLSLNRGVSIFTVLTRNSHGIRLGRVRWTRAKELMEEPDCPTIIRSFIPFPIQQISHDEMLRLTNT
ncbi:MAG: hypothetical protein ACLVB1_02140 [Blautia obeum]